MKKVFFTENTKETKRMYKDAVKVLILGGGFCGASVAKVLQRDPRLQVTLIDKTPYFEYSGSVPKLLTQPGYVKKLILPYERFLKQTKLVTGEVTTVTPTFVETPQHSYGFDLLVISLGVDYPIYVENKHNVFTVAKCTDVLKRYEHITAAEHILIVGGGITGTEVAGELATHYPAKKVCLIEADNRLLSRSPPRASFLAQQFLQKHGVDLLLGEKVVKHQNDSYVTNTGVTRKADVCIWCTGITPNPDYMRQFPDTIYAKNCALNLNDYLQLQGFPNIFVGGDITALDEEKTAHNAVDHARVISQNIRRTLADRPLRKYTIDPEPLFVSLGNRKALYIGENWAVTGFVPSLLKQSIETYFLHIWPQTVRSHIWYL
ncbi:MAG: FAD-dependent oxidoreductase [Candidatus Korarchaeota archaeon]|nr:FAD-dependent oxidoreductase [Candidatus Korarchaeota archaeon]NIU85537.1 FAD-dependent oxidoreductase [Candidatus Thorarchaeota archaeon]NIW15648.1 FAD-dependent oxidoreductase [Candidatus Thorarchaeota archaeon]NIW53578.1 FAD-dependent oxidoreductase [Candidatus Korarchaeota archaeon]